MKTHSPFVRLVRTTTMNILVPAAAEEWRVDIYGVILPPGHSFKWDVCITLCSKPRGKAKSRARGECRVLITSLRSVRNKLIKSVLMRTLSSGQIQMLCNNVNIWFYLD